MPRFLALHTLFGAAVASMLMAGTAAAQTVIGGGKAGVTFPVMITQSGSYKLAGNLNVPAGSDGIVIGSGLNVTIDLGGHQIAGPIQCTKDGCDANAVTTGIKMGSSNVRIHSGTVRGFGAYGIGREAMGVNNRLTLEDVTLKGNGGGVQAITVLFTRVMAENNAFHGIDANRGVITESVAMSNGATGIQMTGGVVRSCSSFQNGRYGFDIGFGMYDGLMSHFNGMGNKLSGSAGVSGLY